MVNIPLNKEICDRPIFIHRLLVTHNVRYSSRTFSMLLAIAIVCWIALLHFAVAADTSTEIKALAGPDRDLTFEQVIALDPSQFERLDRSDFSFGYTKTTAWLRVTVTSETDKAVILSMAPNFTDLIDIYVGREEKGAVAGDFLHIATGDHRPVPADGLSGLDDAVELDLRAGEPALVYIRLEAVGSALTTKILVYPKVERPYRQTVSLLMSGIWFGGMGILGIIQLVFFYYDRKPRNLLLAIATFMVGVVYMGSLGVSRMLFFPNGGGGNDMFFAVSIWLSLITSTLAGIQILDVRENSPWLHRIFLAFVVIGMAGVAFAVSGQQLVFAPFGSIASIGLATLATFQGVRTANSGGAATRLRAVAYGILWAGVVAVMMQRTALIDLPEWTVHGYAVACMLQTILLTAAIGVRLREAENLNRAMQKEAIIAAQAAEERATGLVEERTRELVIARQTAEDALQAELASQQQQVRFMEVISHQYRTPLAAIQNFVANIGLSLPPTDDANRVRLDRVRSGILRLVEVVEVNMERARMQGPAFQPLFAKVLITDIVEAAVTRGRDLLQSRIVIRYCPGAARVRVQGDIDMLVLAIINLLENAVKFSRSKIRQEVLVSCEVRGDHVRIAIIDKGIGIPAEEIATIFHPAHRGTNAKGVEGAGIGLSLVDRIVRSHRGWIDTQSVVSEGTTITINLPIVGDQEATGSGPSLNLQ